MPDEADLTAVLNPHQANELTLRLVAPEDDSVADLLLQRIERHVRLMPAVGGDDAFVGLRGIIDDREKRRQVGHRAGADVGRAHIGTIPSTDAATALRSRDVGGE